MAASRYAVILLIPLPPLPVLCLPQSLRMRLQRLCTTAAPAFTAPLTVRCSTSITQRSFRSSLAQQTPLRRTFHTRTATLAMATGAPPSPSAAAAGSPSPSVSRGALIVLEGLDRSGKSSQCVMLAEALNKNKSGSAVQMRFPGRQAAAAHSRRDCSALCHPEPAHRRLIEFI